MTRQPIKFQVRLLVNTKQLTTHGDITKIYAISLNAKLPQESVILNGTNTLNMRV